MKDFKLKIKDYLIILGIIGALIMSIIALMNSFKENTPLTPKYHSRYQVYAVEMPTTLSFCGEKVPLEKEDVYERFDRELHINTYWRNNTIILYKNTRRWFPIIEKILAEQGIPDDFKYLAVAESKLKNVVSPRGAAGFWQIMPETGRELGLEVNEEVDERFDPIKATYTACKYFKQAHKKFGNWTAVAASYNRGMNGYIRAIKKQKEDDYYNLRLNEETSRYLFRIVALKEVMEKPKKYGFDIQKARHYNLPKTKTLKIDSSITNLVDFSHQNGITYKTLRIHNPWIQEINLPNSTGKIYHIKIPIEKDWIPQSHTKDSSKIMNTVSQKDSLAINDTILTK